MKIAFTIKTDFHSDYAREKEGIEEVIERRKKKEKKIRKDCEERKNIEKKNSSLEIYHRT
ncbi:unnamed protein product [Chironomus riparius]|uniref:Uncharacterized protein n=1 Tax=Chironomus riparius TaxID=315576 RepID=A0A9N9RW05_9DIPT|nr:unnamed protein product [Chironomus riparius]